MKQKQIFALLMALLLLSALLCGCGAKSGAYDSGYYSAHESAVSENGYWDAPEEPASGSSAFNNAAPLPENRKWVITMNIDAETEDLDNALEAINAQILALNGYIEDQYIRNGNYYSSSSRTATLTVRIPAEHVDAFVQEVSGCTHVVTSSRTVTDITLSYTDTETRIEALRAEEARLLELMGMAENMDDLLTIEARLTEVRYELERYSSQLRRFDNQVDYATITLDIDEVRKYTPAEPPTFWEQIGSGFVQSLKDLVQNLSDILIFIIVNLPHLGFLALIGWIIALIVKANKKRTAAKRAQMYAEYMARQEAAKQAEAKTEEVPTPLTEVTDEESSMQDPPAGAK